jgi:MscS family membrane protein
MELMDFLRRSVAVEGGWGLAAKLFLVVLVVVVANALVAIALRRLQLRLQATSNPWDDALVDALRRPVTGLVWLLGLSFAAELFRYELEAPADIFDMADPVRDVGVIALIAWFLLRFIRRTEDNLVRIRLERGRPLDHTTIDAVGKLLRLSVVITAVLVVLQTLGFSIAGVLAFGGVGGIAVGLAARDLLANFFGGLTVYLDRPFSVGDWIRSPDRDIEGTVERIGWRQTCIRTFDQRPLYVPNSTFNQIAIENPSRMWNRRIYETTGIRYDDADKMAAIVADVRAMLERHPDIDTGRTLIVNFTSFGPSSLDFFVYTFTRTTEWVRYHAVKQDVLLKIFDIVTGHGAEIAFPTSTLHVPNGLRLVGDEAGFGEAGPLPNPQRA